MAFFEYLGRKFYGLPVVDSAELIEAKNYRPNISFYNCLAKDDSATVYPSTKIYDEFETSDELHAAAQEARHMLKVELNND